MPHRNKIRYVHLFVNVDLYLTIKPDQSCAITLQGNKSYDICNFYFMFLFLQEMKNVTLGDIDAMPFRLILGGIWTKMDQNLATSFATINLLICDTNKVKLGTA